MAAAAPAAFTKEISSRTRGYFFRSGVITCDGSGDGSAAHGLPGTPQVVTPIPLDGADRSAVQVDASSTNVIIANGGSGGKYLVEAWYLR